MKSPRLLAVVGVLGLVAVACSGGASDTTTSTALTTLPPVAATSPTTTTTSTTTTTTTTTTTIPLTASPLNGIGLTPEVELQRRAVAVKIDNHPDARPQSGIPQADFVYELIVEGGLTRFIAVFYSQDSAFVGPVRSGRPTDPTLVKPMNAPLQFSGAQGWVTSIINNAGVKLIPEGSTTERLNTRRAPHNLYGDTTLMREYADARAWPDDPPPPQFEFGEPVASDTPAEEIILDWSDAPVVRWEWDGTQYVRFNADTPHEWQSEDAARGLVPDGDESGDAASGDGSTTTTTTAADAAEEHRGQISTDTLVVLTAQRYIASPGGGRAGKSVPALRTVGTGQALLFHDGAVIEGTWERGSIDQPFELMLSDGSSMVVPPGRIWVSIFPSSSSLEWK